MSALYLTVFFAAMAGLATLTLWHVRKRKDRRTQLRLLRGRRRLLEEEINAQTQALSSIDEAEITRSRERADQALDALNIALVERQAHLLNFADLAHLLDYKIQLHNEEIERGEPVPTPRPTTAVAKRVERSRPEAESPQRKDRNQIENQLLKKIGQINKKD